MNRIKSTLAAIPVIVCLAGPAMAALSDDGEAPDQNGVQGAIENLINRYAGLAPSDTNAETVTHVIPPSQRFSAFTPAAATMSSGYTMMGGVRLISQSNLDNDMTWRASTGNAAAPSVATVTAAHHAPDLLVTAVSAPISPSSSSASSSTVSPSSSGSIQYQLTTTIVPLNNSQTVPIPPACFMFGSGLLFLTPLRQRLRAMVA